MDIEKILRLEDELADAGVKSYFAEGISNVNVNDLFDIMFDVVHSLDDKEKKALKVILKTNNELLHQRILGDMEEKVTKPLEKVAKEFSELAKEFSELRKEFYGNGKNK